MENKNTLFDIDKINEQIEFNKKTLNKSSLKTPMVCFVVTPFYSYGD